MEPVKIDLSKLSPQEKLALLPKFKKTLAFIFLLFILPSLLNLITGNVGSLFSLVVIGAIFYVVWRIGYKNLTGPTDTKLNQPIQSRDTPKNTVDILSQNIKNTGDPFL